MLRFIFNFFLFGLIFFLIYIFFPEAFANLVSWANNVYLFFEDIFYQASDKIQSPRHSAPAKEMLRVLFLHW